MTTPADYKHLVVIFLFGGNDTFNTILPTDATRVARYNTARGIFALPMPTSGESIKTLALGASGFAVHPRLTSFQSMFAAGDLACLHGVGPLIQPTTVAQYRANLNNSTIIPQGLFAHDEQQLLWMNSSGLVTREKGWGGQAAITQLPNSVLSFNGAQRFGLSQNGAEISLPLAGSFFGLEGFTPVTAERTARAAARASLFATSTTNQLRTAYKTRKQRADQISTSLGPMLEWGVGNVNVPSAINTPFTGLGGDLSRQLFQVAKTIDNADLVGGNRHISFVGLGGFDTHASEWNAGGVSSGGANSGQHAGLMFEVNEAVNAFYTAINSLGLNNKVTTLIISEFGRTLPANNRAGTDHAWDGTAFVIGGSATGGHYGTYPDMEIGGASDAFLLVENPLGRFVPTTSVDQLANTLLQWWTPGLVMTDVTPNLTNWSAGVRNLGFMA
jgi:uncharacterized protein (DUF1501 family)